MQMIDRFMDKVSPEPNSGCWLWTADCAPNGYGRMSTTRERGPVYAHRLSYQFFCGEIPEGGYVLHKCDVRSCVNPDHLYAGTHADNMRDMVERGRAARGPRPWRKKDNF